MWLDHAWLDIIGIDDWSTEGIDELKTLLLKKSATGDEYELRGD